MTDLERQIEREVDGFRNGAVRYLRSHEGDLATDSTPVMDLIRKCFDGFAKAIADEQARLTDSKGGKLPPYALALLCLPAEILALIALGVLFNEIAESEFDENVAASITSVAQEIGKRSWLERENDVSEGRAIDVAALLRPRNQSGHANRRAQKWALQVDDEKDWTKNHRTYHLGYKLVAMAVATAKLNGQPVFEMQNVRENEGRSTKTTARIALTEAAGDWIADHPQAMAYLNAPMYQPTLIPPRDWTSLSDGGYFRTKTKLLKRLIGKRAQQLMERAEMPLVLCGVNAMQNTPYRINKDVEGLVRRGWEAGLLIFGLPTHALQPLPARLPKDADRKKIAERQRERAEIFALNNKIKGFTKRMAFRLPLSEQLRDLPQFYFPHQLDHRGRAYPMPQSINTQVDDLGRAVLEFAEGKPLGKRGAYWLAIHIANCFWKGRKAGFDERLAWVNEHEPEIIAFADNPLRDHPFWREAHKPWMLLAACREWKGYREQGPGFRSHLPIGMDGSCNGYQHLSAMGRDPIGGRAVNLAPGLPGAAPEDLYQSVLNLANARIEIDAAKPGPNQEAARQLRGKLDRDDVKPAAMTTPYGVTWRTIFIQLLNRKAIKSCEDPAICASYLAGVLQECVGKVAVEAGKIMNWLQQVAGILADKNRGMAWTSPAGFIVIHENRVPKTVRIVTADQTFKLYEYDEERKIDKRKQVGGIAANLVHSFDAAHMMRTIYRLLAEGIRHFAMVHDSFGVHACDVDTLNRVLREEFVRIYSEPVLQNFLDELRKANPDIHLPDVPPAGDLDIRQVLESPYFFA